MISNDSYVISPITVIRGVLQGDRLSPLLFNLVINTLIKIITQDKINCMGYFYHLTLAPNYCIQFTDHTTLVTSLESNNQHLRNAFLKW